MALDSLKIEQNHIIGGGITPTGTILPFASDNAPDGWIVCDGRSLSREEYSDLFSVIGTAWGSPDATAFNVPDLRGRFLRGHDGGAGRDPDAAGRISSNSGGNTGDNVGSIQGGASALPNSSFTGSISTNSSGDHYHTYYFSDATSGGSYPVGYQNSNRSANTAPAGNHSHTGSATINSGGDNETRPINANVSYIIKI